MPRRKPAAMNSARPLGRGANLPRVEPGPDGVEDYVVRQVPALGATKTYRCPGCDHEIRPGTAHVVAWPVDGPGAEDRRHWHAGCWRGRGSRGPTRRWS